MPGEMETSDRIRLARRRGGMSQTQLAAAVSVARSAVAQWEQLNGPRPTNAHMAQIAVCCNVSYEWLTTGRGAVMTDADDPGTIALDIDLHLYARDDLEKRLLNSFRSLEYPGNQALVELVETLMRRNAHAGMSANVRRKPLRKSSSRLNVQNNLEIDNGIWNHRSKKCAGLDDA